MYQLFKIVVLVFFVPFLMLGLCGFSRCNLSRISSIPKNLTAGFIR